MEKNYTDFPGRTWAQHLIKIRIAHLEGHAALLMDWGIYTHQLTRSLLFAPLIHSTTPSPACCFQTSFERQQAKLGFAPVIQVQIRGQRNLRSMTHISTFLICAHGWHWAYWGTHTADYLQAFFRSKNLLLSPLSCKPTRTSCGDSPKHCTWAAPKKHEALAHKSPKKPLICFQQTIQLNYKISQLLPSFLLYPPGDKLEASISCHAQAIQSSLMMTEVPWGCQHFYSGAIVAK